jgi:hypothetical protein
MNRKELIIFISLFALGAAISIAAGFWFGRMNYRTPENPEMAGPSSAENSEAGNSPNTPVAASESKISTERDPNPPLPAALTEIPPVIKTETAPPLP